MTAAAPTGPAVALPDRGDLWLVQMGGAGDLVLLADAAAALKRARPAGRLVLVCRAAVAAAVRLWPVPPDETVALELDPARWIGPSPALERALDAVQARLAGRRAAVVIDAAMRAGWFPGLVAAMLAADRFVRCPGAPEAPRDALLHLVLQQRGLHGRDTVDIPVLPRRHERERHATWLAACGVALADPGRWRVPRDAGDAAAAWLAAAGLTPGAYLLCAPGGGGEAIKRWPAARFAAVLARAGLPVVVLGAAGEEEALARLAGALRGVPVATFAGAAADLPRAAALVAAARGWLSNDSGTMHLGQAYGVPGVAVFGGGGGWPSYAPWAPGAIGVVMPLPCFGCDWDCMLDHALCVDGVGVPAVAAALDRALRRPDAAPDIVSLPGPAAPVVGLLEAASDTWRAAQRDRTARLESLLHGDRRERRHAQIMDEQARAIAAFEAAYNDRAARAAALEAELAAASRRIAALEAAQGGGVRAHQVALGFGAGNIGDELMAHAFWRQLPDGLTLDVPLFPMAARQRAPWPARHRYHAVDLSLAAGDWTGNEAAGAAMPGLLVGGTPVADAEGLDFPLRFLAPRLRHFHDSGWSVDAVGVGVEPLESAEGRALFAALFLPVRSWTVRSPACRDTLVALGVDPAAVAVGADWAWLALPARDRGAWAADWLLRHGLDPARPLLLANVVNMQWRDGGAHGAIAAALDAVAARHGLQVGFLCNECRDGDFFDHAAARAVAGLMRRSAVVLPNLYYAPDEAVALLRHAAVSVGQRYHFIVESVLAGAVPVAVPRGAKIRDLAAELGIDAVGSAAAVDADALAAAIDGALADLPARRLALADRQRALAGRAAANLDFLRRLPPYAPLWGG